MFVGIGVGVGRQRVSGGAFVGLLDLYPSASVAYSLRKLSGTYTGNAIRVRRASDNTEQNIGFDALGNLDTTALTTFCSGTNGFVTTWYDQSGNSRDATQTTAANQPQIVSSGSVIMTNTKPSFQFDGTNDTLLFGNDGIAPTDLSVFVVRGITSYPSTNRTLFQYKTLGLTYNSNGGSGYGNGAHIFRSGTTVKSDNYPTLNNQALDFIYNLNNLERNTFSATLSNGAVYTTSTNRIGGFNATLQLFLGHIQEIAIYELNQNSNKSAIKTNINSYYGIY